MKYSFFLAFGLITFAQSSLQAFPASNLKVLSAQIFLATQSDDSNSDNEEEDECKEDCPSSDTTIVVAPDVTSEEKAEFIDEAIDEAKELEENPEVQIDSTGDVDPTLQDFTGGETIEVYESITGEESLRCTTKNGLKHCYGPGEENMMICVETNTGDEADIVCLTAEEYEKFCPCARKKK